MRATPCCQLPSRTLAARPPTTASCLRSPPDLPAPHCSSAHLPGWQQGEDKAQQACEGVLSRLGTPYVDLVRNLLPLARQPPGTQCPAPSATFCGQMPRFALRSRPVIGTG